jgi:uncharacterized protein
MTHPDLKLSRFHVASPPVLRGRFHVLYSTRSLQSQLVSVDVYASLVAGRFDRLDAATRTALAASQILVPQQEDELTAVVGENRAAIATDQTLFYAIAPSADCQLGCDYCGQAHTKAKMAQQQRTDALARLYAKLDRDPHYRRVQVGWFGAEPLTGLHSIVALSAELVQETGRRGLAYDAKIVTNGLALTPDVFFQLRDACAVTDFEVTLDGTERFHDARRYTKKGHASYRLIVRNLEAIVADPRFAAGGAELIVRCNVDARNHAGAEELVEELAARGLLPHVKFYTSPIHSWGNTAHHGALDHRTYAAFEIDILRRLMDKGARVRLVPSARKKIVCMSLKRDAELVDAYGDVYNCSEVSQVAAYAEVKMYKLDRLGSTGAPLVDQRPFSDWNDGILQHETPCGQCSILPICGGSCPKLWREGISPCPAMKENFGARLVLQLAQMNRVKPLAPAVREQAVPA